MVHSGLWLSGARDSIFGPRLDFLVFVLPAVLAAVLALLFDLSSGVGLILLYAVYMLVDTPHLFATWPVIWMRYHAGSLKGFIFWMILLGTPVVTFAIFKFSEKAFLHTLAYFAIFHHVRQQYGWLILSRKKAGETTGLAWDIAVLIAIVAGPLALRHSDASRLPNAEVNSDDIFIFLSSGVANVFMALSIAVVIAYIVRSWLTANLGLTKAMILFSTAVWFLAAQAYVGDQTFFWMSSSAIHATPYLLLTYRSYSNPSSTSRPVSWPLSKIWTVFLVVGAGVLFAYLVQFEANQNETLWQLAPLLWLPAFYHYIFDGLIWKSKRFDPSLDS